MYDYLNGQVTEKTATTVILEVAGVGYYLQIPLSTSEALPALGQSVKLLVHFVVREDAHMLYGFKTQEERQLFRSFLSVNGIGPKLALTVLSGIPMETLKRAIVRGELETLTGISGIGKKTAERIIVELREKMVLQAQPEPGLTVPGAAGQTALIEDSVEALIALGYRKPNARAAIEKAMKTVKAGQMTVEELIRTSLKHV